MDQYLNNLKKMNQFEAQWGHLFLISHNFVCLSFPNKVSGTVYLCFISLVFPPREPVERAAIIKIALKHHLVRYEFLIEDQDIFLMTSPVNKQFVFHFFLDLFLYSFNN